MRLDKVHCHERECVSHEQVKEVLRYAHVGKIKRKTYNTRYSLVVTDPTTNPALTGLSMGERTGSRVFQWVWSYVLGVAFRIDYELPSQIWRDLRWARITSPSLPLV
ncbi:hypothetical protein CTRU02_208931 [Colletotrichum truncatum]|uniref:Uncharacterized protein n=1 Tax=Colletotrichum truncatum TaxID=5467 RepID=A0ACC3YXS9_COLTU